ncbi:MAG: hypothetical protein EBT85_01120 [Synechococcaceae bacterium WB5_2B_268]|nr:hypothetical protein [Synechococcaceae bacterium WB5_2B_268]
MTLDPSSMPPLVRDFAEAVRDSPDDQAWLRLHGHALIDSLAEPDGGSAAMVLEILRLMRARSGAEGDRGHWPAR